MWHSYFSVETAGRVFVSSTSKSYFCLISLLNCFIFSPGENLNNTGEKSFLLHLELEEDYRKFSDKSPSSKNSVIQIAIARKIFTKMVATWVSSCWPDRVNQYSSVWVPMSVLMFSSVQYVSKPRRTAWIFWRLYFDWFWFQSILKIPWEKCRAKLKVFLNYDFKAFITASWQWSQWEIIHKEKVTSSSVLEHAVCKKVIVTLPNLGSQISALDLKINIL